MQKEGENMLKLVLMMGILTVTASTGHAWVDYTCQTDCTKRGYSYSYCREKCSYGDSSNSGYDNIGTSTLRFRDYKCMQDCQKLGYRYSYCSEVCSY